MSDDSLTSDIIKDFIHMFFVQGSLNSQPQSEEAVEAVEAYSKTLLSDVQFKRCMNSLSTLFLILTKNWENIGIVIDLNSSKFSTKNVDSAATLFRKLRTQAIKHMGSKVDSSIFEPFRIRNKKFSKVREGALVIKKEQLSNGGSLSTNMVSDSFGLNIEMNDKSGSEDTSKDTVTVQSAGDDDNDKLEVSLGDASDSGRVTFYNQLSAKDTDFYTSSNEFEFDSEITSERTRNVSMKFIYDEANIMGKLFWAIVELNLKGESVDLYTRMILFYWPEWCTEFKEYYGRSSGIRIRTNVLKRRGRAKAFLEEKEKNDQFKHIDNENLRSKKTKLIPGRRLDEFNFALNCKDLYNRQKKDKNTEEMEIIEQEFTICIWRQVLRYLKEYYKSIWKLDKIGRGDATRRFSRFSFKFRVYGQPILHEYSRVLFQCYNDFLKNMNKSNKQSDTGETGEAAETETDTAAGKTAVDKAAGKEADTAADPESIEGDDQSNSQVDFGSDDTVPRVVIKKKNKRDQKRLTQLKILVDHLKILFADRDTDSINLKNQLESMTKADKLRFITSIENLEKKLSIDYKKFVLTLENVLDMIVIQYGSALDMKFKEKIRKLGALKSSKIKRSVKNNILKLKKMSLRGGGVFDNFQANRANKKSKKTKKALEVSEKQLKPVIYGIIEKIKILSSIRKLLDHKEKTKQNLGDLLPKLQKFIDEIKKIERELLKLKEVWVLQGTGTSTTIVKQNYETYKEEQMESGGEQMKSGGGFFKKNKGVVNTRKGEIIFEHYEHVNGIVTIMTGIKNSIEDFEGKLKEILNKYNNTLDSTDAKNITDSITVLFGGGNRKRRSKRRKQTKRKRTMRKQTKRKRTMRKQTKRKQSKRKRTYKK
jgi:hypothetical protein